MTRTTHRGAGQALAEFALIAPLLLLLLLIVIDFGRMYLGWINLQNAARIAANYAAANPTADFGPGSDYQQTILADTSGIDCTPSLTSPVFAPDSNVGSSATVSLRCSFQPMTPFVSGFFGGNVQMGATAVFPIRSGHIAGVPVPPGVECVSPNIAVPSLVGMTISAAKTSWATAGFTGSFTPSGPANKVVNGQVPSAGSCRPPTQTMVVTWK